MTNRRTPGARGGIHRLRALLADPPLSVRLTWREGIFPATLISEDRGLVARTFGTLYVVGGTVGLATVLIADGAVRDRGWLAAICMLALLLGAVCFIGYRRLPPSAYHVMAFLGTALITAAVATAAPGAEHVYAIFYVWLVFLVFLILSARAAALQLALASVAYSLVLAARDAPFAATAIVTTVATLATIGGIMALVRTRLEQMTVDLASEAATDPVTALANRRGFDSRFPLEVDLAQRSGRPLSLVVCDLDRFKAVNDRLGHEEGDRALRRVAAAIANSLRAADSVARLGGEEFCVLLPDTSAAEAFRIAERIRTSIESAFDDYPISLTASCGVACLGGGVSDTDALFRAADAALFAAKEAGRNRTSMQAADPAPLRGTAAG
jgi:diguanylate cyclase (GGDEF)-like protein